METSLNLPVFLSEYVLYIMDDHTTIFVYEYFLQNKSSNQVKSVNGAIFVTPTVKEPHKIG